MRIDLHSHSHVSDGALSPADLVARARQKDVEVLALTDHDTVDGLAAAAIASKEAGIQLIPGVEFSCQWGGRTIHVLGLNINPDHVDLKASLASQVEKRFLRAQQIDERLSKAGIQGALSGAKRIAGKSVLGRPHFAQFLVEAGYVNSVDKAFKKYLGTGKPGDVRPGWPTITEVIERVNQAQGKAVLAHPAKYKLTRTKLKALVTDFTESGGCGLEVISGNQPVHVTRQLAMIACEFGLKASCGSDFHSPGEPWRELGAFGELPSISSPIWDVF